MGSSSYLSVKKKIVVSDAAPLIQLALVHRLELLPRLYDVVIPDQVFVETQHYAELPDALEIAKASGKWLEVRAVKDRKQVSNLMEQRLGEGEAQAIVLCREIGAASLLTSDKYAMLRAARLGLKTITLADVIREAYSTKILTAPEAVSLLEALIDQNILNTGFVRQLLREAKTWP
jgi:predicted nucleic acid-binding protein